MSLYIRDAAVDELAKQVQQIIKAPNKTEAVRRALMNEIARSREIVPLKDRIANIQNKVFALKGLRPDVTVMQKYIDDIYEDD